MTGFAVNQERYAAWRQVDVDVVHATYPILIGEGVLEEAGILLKTKLPQPRAIVVTDDNVEKHYLPTLLESLKSAGIDAHSIVLRPGEGTKSTTCFVELMEVLLSFKPERKTTLIALGGGVIGDITGFAASTLLRGVPFVQIPTTLLSQVDSSVGGKTGINSSHGKNLIGSFYQPLAVLADTGVLKTLPHREMLAGYAEILKYGLIGDPEFYGWLLTHGKDVVAGEREALAHAIELSCRAKAEVVGSDEKESGARALLNFGHTFAHALEKDTGYGALMLHGEAVALGMLMATYASVEKGAVTQAELDTLLAHYTSVGLPQQLTSYMHKWDVSNLMPHLFQDKKVESGKLRFVLLESIGKAYVTGDITLTQVEHAFRRFL